MMKKFALIVIAATALSSASAFAADMKVKAAPPPPPPPSPWDIAFGGGLASDYIWRGITQSNHQASYTAYTELRYNFSPTLQAYVGTSGESISFPNRAAAEVDVYGGIRPTVGPVAFDVGVWGYLYPGGQCFHAINADGGFFGADCLSNSSLPVNGNVAKKDWSFYEVYGKFTWTVNDQWAVGGNLFYSPNILNTGADGTYVSGTLKYTAPAAYALWNGAVGWYVSGEYGEQFLGTSDAFYGTGVPGNIYEFGVPYKDYQTWNVGLGFTWKVFTLDLRYYDTNLSKADCNVYTSDNTASYGAAFTATNLGGYQSNWCDARFVAKLSFDLTLANLK